MSSAAHTNVTGTFVPENPAGMVGAHCSGLREVEVERLTPLEALNLLAQIKKAADD